MTIILEEKFDVGTDVYGDFIRRYHGSIIRRLDKFHSEIGIVGPVNLTRDSRWSTVSVTNLRGNTIEIAKCLESLWVHGYRCGPSHPWRLVTDNTKMDFSSLPGRHESLYFNGKYLNDMSTLNVSKSSLDNAITVLDIYAKTLNQSRNENRPDNAQEARRSFLILVLYFAEALRILPIRDLLQEGFEQYEQEVFVDYRDMQLARNWEAISFGFLSGSYSTIESYGIDNEVTLKQKLWLIYNKKTPLHELDGVRPNGWLGDPGNGGDAGAPEGKSGRGGHSGDGGPSSGANQGDSKNHAGGGQSRDQVAGRGSRLPKGKRCSIELFNNHFIKIQNLTTQLVELERHFNTLEINRFGEMGRAGFNRRNVYNHPGSSKQTQSLHSVYNTLNSQLAAAEQLSECLTKQISMLNLGPPSPSPSKPAGSVKKQLFESIGLSYEPESYTSPDVPRPVIDSSSVKRVSTLVKDYRRRSSVGPAKGVELETARRRRESLNKSWASVEPHKTTVKRVEKQLQPVQQKRFSIGSDKKFKSSREIFRKDMEAATIHQTSRYGSPVSLLLEPSNTKLNAPPLTQGIEEEAPNQAAMPQQGVPFRWARGLKSIPKSGAKSSNLSGEESNRGCYGTT